MNKINTNYFTKVENKFVFNVSLIFWHLFIALSMLAIVASSAVFIWSIIPPFEKKVVKKPYPAKKPYPEPVKVSLNELNLEESKQAEPLPEPPPPSEIIQEPAKPAYEDTNGKAEYEVSLNVLKELVPPSKYSWEGTGHYIYPYGERYWSVYKQAKYRQWISTEPGVEEKLQSSYRVAKAKSYPEKKQILDGFIAVVKLLSEEKRLGALQYLIGNVANNIKQNMDVCRSIEKAASKMTNEENLFYINQLASFGKKNPNDGSRFIEYISIIIDKFDATQRVKVIDGLINSYYGYFGQNFSKQKEATDLFIPMLAQIKGEHHSKVLIQYYGIYLGKNHDRDTVIDEIENEFLQKQHEIDGQYESEKAAAAIQYRRKEATKSWARIKSLLGIGSSILAIVLIATILVFLSIQRSVSRIEEKISFKNNS